MVSNKELLLEHSTSDKWPPTVIDAMFRTYAVSNFTGTDPLWLRLLGRWRGWGTTGKGGSNNLHAGFAVAK
jgi:hypothetical protein